MTAGARPVAPFEVRLEEQSLVAIAIATCTMKVHRTAWTLRRDSFHGFEHGDSVLAVLESAYNSTL